MVYCISNTVYNGTNNIIWPQQSCEVAAMLNSTLVINISYFAAGYSKGYSKLSAKFSGKYSSVLVCLIDQYIFLFPLKNQAPQLGNPSFGKW
jgi:hypothetical protein